MVDGEGDGLPELLGLHNNVCPCGTSTHNHLWSPESQARRQCTQHACIYQVATMVEHVHVTPQCPHLPSCQHTQSLRVDCPAPTQTPLYQPRQLHSIYPGSARLKSRRRHGTELSVEAYGALVWTIWKRGLQHCRYDSHDAGGAKSQGGGTVIQGELKLWLPEIKGSPAIQAAFFLQCLDDEGLLIVGDESVSLPLHGGVLELALGGVITSLKPLLTSSLQTGFLQTNTKSQLHTKYERFFVR
mmetsp:Transcript_19441/g.50459  ORF Transcript_19441/g.50459 Transcript_19441/m.50459 type:complete len:243 (-) Transcript_19441:2-730(-)